MNVSVLMSVHNGAAYLAPAIQSILTQTFSDFEFIIVDDASTDATQEILHGIRDPRVRLLHNETNCGLTVSLNRGLDIARGNYIARMDADDISMPKRLARQRAFLAEHLEVGACGTWAWQIDAKGEFIGERCPPVGRRLERDFWRPSPLLHPSVMFRQSATCPWRYDETLPAAQDYDLWWRIRSRAALANIPEFLLQYRVHGGAVSATRRAQQLQLSWEIFRRHTGLQQCSYPTFLGLVFDSLDLTPWERLRARYGLARKLAIPYTRFLWQDLRYCRRWLTSVTCGKSDSPQPGQ